ncbi:MAG TPA: ATP-binding protein [Phenylobacterium sp.]|uniref:ATP-binding protein n=1 Tax=Phenylobacterium sp. TaxID=1871053 RepID=UPI002F9526B8
MVEALRGLGYSTSTALADIVDNSIAAGAANVDLTFHWAGADSHIAIADDGRGMDEGELDLAMRLGARNPLDDRAAGDLGRFGLGLKTASFSQARRLTVASRKAGSLSCLRWDLDELAREEGDGWYMLVGPAPGSEGLLSPLDEMGSGTLVLWEKLDRIVTAAFGEPHFLDLIDVVEAHLAMTFHRYLEGVRPKLRIAINGRAIRPWDPFLTGESATWSSPVVVLDRARGISAQAHVLPHQDFLKPAVHRAAAGPEGWTSQQGFYVYRNERLLVAGGWLGLGSPRAWTRDEACRLARIRIDLPNSADADWKIDIRKSTARPPATLRRHLTHLADDARSRAREVFAHRGVPSRGIRAQPVAEAWRVEHRRSGVRYRIDEAHPAIAAILDQAGDLSDDVRAMLRVIEETVPVQRIWLDTAEARETPRVGFSADPPEEVGKVLLVLFRNLVGRKGYSVERAIERLMHTEPFHEHPDLVAALALETVIEPEVE